MEAVKPSGLCSETTGQERRHIKCKTISLKPRCAAGTFNNPHAQAFAARELGIFHVCMGFSMFHRLEICSVHMDTLLE